MPSRFLGLAGTSLLASAAALAAWSPIVPVAFALPARRSAQPIGAGALRDPDTPLESLAAKPTREG